MAGTGTIVDGGFDAAMAGTGTITVEGGSGLGGTIGGSITAGSYGAGSAAGGGLLQTIETAAIKTGVSTAIGQGVKAIQGGHSAAPVPVAAPTESAPSWLMLGGMAALLLLVLE